MPKSNLRKQQASLQPVKSKARTSKSNVRENQYADILEKLQGHDQELYGLEFSERNGKTQVKRMRSQGSGGRRTVEEIGFERSLKRARVVVERGREGERVENEVEMGTGDDQLSESETGFGSRSSDEEDDDEDDEESLKAVRLAALEAHSRALLGLPSMPTESVGMDDESEGEDDDDDKNEEEEGTGEEYISDDGWGADDGFVSDSEDEFTNGQPEASSSLSTSRVPEVVFDPSTASGSSSMPVSKAERRAFLTGTSVKMMGITTQSDYLPGRPRSRPSAFSDVDAEGDLEDRTNASLDKTLHSMLLTTLLPSHAASTASRPVDKRNAMSARLLELAQYELPGEGNKVVKDKHLSKHPAAVRTGLLHKREKREKAQRQEAIDSGNYVRGIGGLG
ncbi:hypothetical protein I307_04564 [Cryptococcus deuterogattii 99/473]|uniref:Uncharacterized protein n=1 Tax=Cryptococcus deuterogattii Ram5 TaxID=1296110 RepID=A0A0D0V7U0_9TREE|nr:hypothetical protein I313_01827 [Cryptococcus deuterogattii Ram5]KIS00235.1 hypothetical protein L804_01644 [Cryptococcus deuterogattii 2001/935-1]KIY56169.1 hypothetical protein I307_04564 [Cryptococcus deuterogattii 99/473]